MANVKGKWFQNLTRGMDQSSNPSMTDDSPHLQNIILDRPGVWSRRKGTAILGDSLGTDPGYGLFSYLNNSGTFTLMAVANTNLYSYNGTAWSSIDTSEWPADTRVDSANFLNRLYLGSADGGTPLQYTTGSSVTEVTPEIGGNVLSVNKNVLFVGGNDIKPNIGFYTDPFTHNFASISGTCASNADVAGANTITATTEIFEPDMIGAVLYNESDDAMAIITGWTSGTVVTTDTDTSTWDSDTISVLQNNFKADNAITACIGYQEQFLVWDENKMYRFDPLSNWTADTENFGCINKRTVGVIEGYVIWANREGAYLWGGSGQPQDITPKIRDKVSGLALWDLIDPANWRTMCAGVDPLEGKYRLSVGTLQTVTGATASAITNVEFVFDVKKNSWTFNSYPDRIMDYTNSVDSSGNKILCVIHQGDAYVVKLNSGTSDKSSTGINVAITYDARTPHRVLSDPTTSNKIRSYFVKYTSDSTVTVSVSVDRQSYETLTTLPIQSTPQTIEIKPKANDEGFSHSLKFTGTGDFKLEGYGFIVEAGTTTRLPSK